MGRPSGIGPGADHSPAGDGTMSPSPGRSRARPCRPASGPAARGSRPSTSCTGQVKTTSWQRTRPDSPGGDHDQEHAVGAEVAEQESRDQRPDVSAAAHRRAGPSAGANFWIRPDETARTRPKPRAGPARSGTRRPADDQHVDGHQPQEGEPGRPAQADEHGVGERRPDRAARVGKMGGMIGRLGARPRRIGGVVSAQAEGEEEVHEEEGQGWGRTQQSLSNEHGIPRRGARRPGGLRTATPGRPERPASRPPGADVVRPTLSRMIAPPGVGRPCEPAWPAAFAGDRRAGSALLGPGGFAQSVDWVRSTVPPSTSSSSVGSLVWSLPDISR